MNYADTNNRHTPRGGSPVRRRTVLARKNANRTCVPIPPEWLTDGKSRTVIVENGVLSLVTEADDEGCIVHRPDVINRVMNREYVVRRPALEAAEGED